MDKVIYRNEKRSRTTNNKSEVSSLFSGVLFQLVFVVVSGIFLFNVYKSVRITSQKLDILNQAEREVEELRLKNLALSIEMLDMSTDTYLEKEARNRLNYGSYDEIAFVIPEGSLDYGWERVSVLLDNSDVIINDEAVDGALVWYRFIVDGV